jgi:hypothetical protein
MMSSTVTAGIIHIEIFGKEIFSSLFTSVDDALRTSYEKLVWSSAGPSIPFG